MNTVKVKKMCALGTWKGLTWASRSIGRSLCNKIAKCDHVKMLAAKVVSFSITYKHSKKDDEGFLFVRHLTPA